MSILDDKRNKYKHLSRKDYFNKNQELSKKLWQTETPTVGDIADFVQNKHNDKIKKTFEFFENEDDFTKMSNRTDSLYEEEESSAFIRKVMSANNEDISKAGYFYKLLMASADDFNIDQDDCESKGKQIDITKIDQEYYDYYMKSMYCEEFNSYLNLDFEQFLNHCNEFGLFTVTIKTPLTCNCSENHGICKKCAGNLPDNTKNIGTFTTLMVTEHATQSALSSMNKGVKENINDLVSLRYDGGYNWEEIKAWISEVVEKLKNKNVQSRFYEIALLSRCRKDQEGPFVSSLKGSINHSGNLFGSYIFTPNNKNFEKIINAKEFEDSSLKLKIAINDFDEIK